MNSINVIRIISDLPVGGVEQRLLELLPLLRPEYNVRVCCIREKDELAPEFERVGIPVDLCYFRGRLHPFSLYQMASYLKRVNAHIVHTHMYRPNISGVLAAKLAGVPVVISHIHNVDHWDNARQMRQDGRFVRFRDKIIAVSEAVREDYIRKTHADPDKCVVIYNGINLDKFSPREKDPELMSEFGLEGKKVVGIIARLVPQKDHETFLQSAVKIKERLSDTRFLIVGEEEGKSGLRQKLQERTVELGLAEEVIFTGMRRDIVPIISLFDVAVQSSLREGFSNVIVETMAMGIPMVATNAGGNAEAIEDGKNGFIVPCQQPDLLAERVVKILRDKELALKMQAHARSQANLFSLETMAQKTKDLYHLLLAEKGIKPDSL
jgi:glycosyltransferase involved in cell wall biosynthesis